MAFIKKNTKKIIRKAKDITPNKIDNNPKISSNISLVETKYKTKEAINPIKKKINLLVTKLNFSLLNFVFLKTPLEDFLELFFFTPFFFTIN